MLPGQRPAAPARYVPTVADETWVDVEELERHCAEGRRADRAGDAATAVRCCAAADRLYEGDLLADDPYLSWTSLQRESMCFEVLHGQRRLAELYAANGDHAGAALVGRRAPGIDPYDEAVHRQLMLSFRDVGQLHLGLAQFHRCADLLWEAFRIRPSPQTVALNEQLRRHQPMVTATRVHADRHRVRAGGRNLSRHDLFGAASTNGRENQRSRGGPHHLLVDSARPAP